MKIKLLLAIILVLSFVSHCAAVDVKVEGTAVKDFHRIGAWCWDVKVEKVISGPGDMHGRLISIFLTSANPVEYPPGSLDFSIKAADTVKPLASWRQSSLGITISYWSAHLTTTSDQRHE